MSFIYVNDTQYVDHNQGSRLFEDNTTQHLLDDVQSKTNAKVFKRVISKIHKDRYTENI